MHAVPLVPQVVFPEPLQHLVVLIGAGRFARPERQLLPLAPSPKRVNIVSAVFLVHVGALNAVEAAGKPRVLNCVVYNCARDNINGE
jgi:hypothetical protein